MKTDELAEKILIMCIENGVTVNQLKNATSIVVDQFLSLATIDKK